MAAPRETDEATQLLLKVSLGKFECFQHLSSLTPLGFRLHLVYHYLVVRNHGARSVRAL